MENKQWELRKHERVKHNYTKWNSNYWDVEISQQRKKRRPATEAPILQSCTEDDATTEPVHFEH